MKKLLTLAFVLVSSQALADNRPVNGYYVFDEDNAVSDSYKERWSCGVDPIDFVVKFRDGKLMLKWENAYYVADVTHSTDDRGVWATWTSEELMDEVGSSVTVHLWHPDNAAINARLSISSFDSDGDRCGNAWRYVPGTFVK